MNHGIRNSFRNIYRRIFHNESLSGCLIKVYSIWLVSLNMILILLTIPNIVNPGPLKDLNILYHNADGFVDLRNKSPSPILFTSKIADFQGYLFSEKPDVVILNETWLNSAIRDSEIFPNDSYKVFRRDRSNFSHPPDKNNPNKFKKLGGGVIIAFKSDLDITTTEYKISQGGVAKAEILSVVVKSGTASKVCFSTLYRVGTLGDENLAEVKRHLRSISKSKSIHKHILFGDLNLSKTLWPEAQTSCNLEKKFVNLFNDLGLEQLIAEPTHTTGNTLDLLLCNQPNIVSDINVMPQGIVCSSPHLSIKFKVKLNCKRLKPTKRRIYNLKKANFRAINEELLSVPWDHILSDNNIDSSLEKFESIFSSICDRYIPKVTVKSSFQPPWFDSELDSICKRKNKLLTKYRTEADPVIKHQLNEEIKKVRKNFRKTNTRKKLDNIVNEDDPALIKKKVWSYFKATSNSCRIPETVRYGSKFRSNNFDIGNLFNKYFSDQFSSPSKYDINIDYSNDLFQNMKFEEKNMFDLLRKMNTNKAAGPDGTQSKLIKMCAKGLAKPLSLLFNKSFETGLIPKKMENCQCCANI